MRAEVNIEESRVETLSELVGQLGGSMKNIIGDYQAFFSLLLGRLNDIHIDISGCEISHLAYRTETYEEYLRTRDDSTT